VQPDKASLVGCVESLAASGFFESDGLQIYYESFGKGQQNPIILDHGWGAISAPAG
jgi:hypothetical protein